MSQSSCFFCFRTMTHKLSLFALVGRHSRFPAI
nr:MAG TPA: hypothetical protein [Caudoviricetes sp.]